jgi:hypothetical protein
MEFARERILLVIVKNGIERPWTNVEQNISRYKIGCIVNERVSRLDSAGTLGVGSFFVAKKLMKSPLTPEGKM